MQGRIDCFKCNYLHITWDPRHPRECRAFGFRSREIPSQVVSRSSGNQCLKFEEKKKK